MKTVIKRVPTSTLKRFAETNNLTMVITERPTYLADQNGRYIASFQHCEVKDGGMLMGAYGNGNTVKEAIKNYTPQISEKHLVIDAMTDKRREIHSPRLS